MNIDGSNVKQITDLGYDGGAFFSRWNQNSFRASRPNGEENKYKLLSQGLVQPTNMELFICDSDGSNLKQLPF